MRKDTIVIFGDPIPTAMQPLAQMVNGALIKAEQSTEAVKTAQRCQMLLQEELSSEVTKRRDAEYLHSRNCGGHFYPHIGEGTSDCDYCDSWASATCSNGGDEGVDPFGDCPGNPKLRDAYELLLREKKRLDELVEKVGVCSECVRRCESPKGPNCLFCEHNPNR